MTETTADPVEPSLRDALVAKAREVLSRRDELPIEADLPALAEEVVWEVASERDDDDAGWLDDEVTDLVWRVVIDALEEVGGLRSEGAS